VIAGVTTECAVESTVRDAAARDYYIVVANRPRSLDANDGSVFFCSRLDLGNRDALDRTDAPARIGVMQPLTILRHLHESLGAFSELNRL
jgi:hypothetical protein